MTEHTGTFLRHEPCTADGCVSSDGMAVYSDGTYCYVCGAVGRTDGESETDVDRFMQAAAGALKHPAELTYEALPKRGLSQETCRRWSYGIYGNAQYATYRDPKDGTPVAQKVRRAGKQFSVLGKMGPLFGQHLWRTQGRRVVVTEGEIDAMSFSQIQSHKYPVVSVPTGAKGAKKAVTENLEWLEGFEEVIFMFDMDEPGQAAAVECCSVLTPGKGKIATLPLKDANEMLVARRWSEATDAMWNARVWRPDGILGGEDVWARILEKKEAGLAYPYAGLNDLLKGIRRGELVTFTAGTGAGKSTICKEIAEDLISRHGQTVGLMALEESVRDTMLGLVSVRMSQPLHLLENPAAEPGVREAFEELKDSVWCYDHWGSVDSDSLMVKLRFMAKGLGCDFIILDHLSIAMSGLEMGKDERRALDKLMTTLRAFVEETGVGMLLVSHLSRGSKDSDSHEQGGEIGLRDLRGSHSIPQLSDAVVALERNQQASEGENLVNVRVLKNRFASKTGLCDTLSYDYGTGRLLPHKGDF